MISINANALAKSLAYLKLKKAQVEKDADKRFRQKLFHLARAAANVSPQFSGDFASNWNLAIDGDMPVYRLWADKVNGSVSPKENDDGTVSYQAHKAGDMAAITTTMARISGQLARVTRKSRVHLVNATDLHTDGKRMIGPDGAVQLRAVNIIPGSVRIESYLRTYAKALPKDPV